MRKLKKYDHVMVFKVTLCDISPEIWRRIVVPDTYTFWDLHVAIQDAMGWLDYHLHAFMMNDPERGAVVEIGIPIDDGDMGLDVVPGWEEPIINWFSETEPATTYLYDFGDSWEHEVVFEERLPREEKIKYPVCTGGERACPPEDCGGVWGYQDLLEILKNPDHEEYEEMIEWLGDSLDPDMFDKDEVHFWDPRERWEIAFREE